MPAVHERALAGIGPAGFPDDFDTQIEEFRRQLGNDDFVLHTFLNDLLGGMSVPLQAAFVQHVVGRDEAWCGCLALYWILSPVLEVRLAAAGGLREQVQRGSLEPAEASTLRLIRTLVPTDGACRFWTRSSRRPARANQRNCWKHRRCVPAGFSDLFPMVPAARVSWFRWTAQTVRRTDAAAAVRLGTATQASARRNAG